MWYVIIDDSHNTRRKVSKLPIVSASDTIWKVMRPLLMKFNHSERFKQPPGYAPEQIEKPQGLNFPFIHVIDQTYIDKKIN